MNPEFQRCLERKKIVPFEKGHTLVEKELRTAHEDFLNKATAILRN
jgi:hypothetical protein